jgi:predicted DNA-binding transcriptional regulator AlpA
MPKQMNIPKVIHTEEDRLITTKELAEILQVGVNSITRSRVYGTTKFPPYLKIGKSVRYRMSTVINFLNGITERNHTSQ